MSATNTTLKIKFSVVKFAQEESELKSRNCFDTDLFNWSICHFLLYDKHPISYSSSFMEITS